MVKYIDNNGCTCCLNTTTVKPSSPAIAFYDGNGTKQYIATTSATLSGHPAFYDSDGCKYYVGVAPAVGNLRMYADHIEVCAAHPFTITLCSCAYSSTCGAAADSLCIVIPANFTGCCTWDNFLNDAVFSKAVEDAANGCTGAYSGYYFTTTGGNLCWDGTCKWCNHCNSLWCCDETDYESYNIGFTDLRCFCAGLWAYNIITGWNPSSNYWSVVSESGNRPDYANSDAVWCCCTDYYPGSGDDPDIYCTHMWTCELKRNNEGVFSIVGQWPQYHSASVTVHCVSWQTCGSSAYGATITSNTLPKTFTGLTTNANNVVNVGLRYNCCIAWGCICCENAYPDTGCIDWRSQQCNYNYGCLGGFLTYGICSSIGGNGTVNTWDNCYHVYSADHTYMCQSAHNCLVVFPAYREISGVSCAHSLQEIDKWHIYTTITTGQ